MLGYKSPTNLVGVQKDFQEWYEEVKNQPNVDHLQVARSWEVVAYAGKTRSNDLWGHDDDDDDGVKIKMVTIHLTNIVVRTSITVRLTET